MVVHDGRTPGEHAAPARAAGRFSGIVQRFSTTTTSAPASAASSSSSARRAVRADGQTGQHTSTGPSPATVTTSKPRSRSARSSPSRRRRRRPRGRDETRRRRRRASVNDGTERSRPCRHGGALAARGLHGPERGHVSVSVALGLVLPRRWSGPSSASRSARYPSSPMFSRPRTTAASCPTSTTGGEPSHHEWFWGRSGSSTITQPPMYGHAVAALRRRGIDVGDDLVERACAGIQFFLRERRHPSGLIAVTHPWETGCDDSPRFDHWGAGDPKRWYDVKGALVAALPDNGFDCAPVSLSALVAWNGRELDLDTADLVDAIAARWDREQCTWIDGGESENTSGRVRTLEALLPLLVVEQPDALASITDSAAFGGAFGPAGVAPRRARRSIVAAIGGGRPGPSSLICCGCRARLLRRTRCAARRPRDCRSSGTPTTARDWAPHRSRGPASRS